MNMNDAPLHLGTLKIAKRDHNSYPYVELPLRISQSHLDSLAMLIQWQDGFKSAGRGEIPGNFELVMFYRHLCHEIRHAETKAVG